MIDILSFLNIPEKTTIALSIPEYINLVKDVILAFTAIVATIIAYYGLATWRKELKGKSEYAIAKQVLKSVYRVREAFIISRSPNISYSKQDNNENPYHINTVIKHLEETFAALEEQILIAQVEWGTEYQDKINTLRDCKQVLCINHRIFEESMKGSDKMQIANDVNRLLTTLFQTPMSLH